MKQVNIVKRKRVLILSEGFGGGHTQAAYAIAAGMKLVSPDIHTKVLELGSFLNPVIAPIILSAYRRTVVTSPALIGMLYRKQYDKPINRLTRLALHKIFYTQTINVIEQLKPDLIICTHYIPSAVISRLKAAGLKVPLYTLITDYDAHAAWINPEIDRYLVSTPEVRRLLMKRGVQPSQIQVTGIPVHPNFWTTKNKSCARSELNLRDIPTVLVMGGGWGLLFKKQVLDTLTSWKDKVQLVFCTGTNEKLAAKLQHHPSFTHPNIVILGHTNEISKWMDAADLLITKPGGMTCTEALAKDLPMLFCESIPGQEDSNREYFINSGYGEMLSSEAIDRWLERLTTRHHHEQSNHSRIKAFKPNYQPDRCVRDLAEMLNQIQAGRSKSHIDEQLLTPIGM
uniref:MGDG synthase family glycosyltransferase n=1 Tax=Paenibacillus tuaregi TaxID=1816681 RepID=UPI000B152B09|nr:glycosyltransferase [Paenibacillus tuaregi]